ncbi:MAG: hypothetical protein KAS11_00255 [Candidatus Aenigmarchaeota archaeon]|nr:hypothetical protein [Candidatus Aenigmarchaeota archaeon]
MDINLVLSTSNIIIAVANLILIFFVYIQIRDTRKPELITKIIPRDKDITDKAEVLEEGTLYLSEKGKLKNIAKNIKIKYIFQLKKHEIIVKENKLSHLNSNEGIKFLLKTKKIMDGYPELFEEKIKGDYTKKMPKESLKINLVIKISYNPIFSILGRYNIEDNYEIEWGSIINYPRFEDHPRFMCWNKRSENYYIYKTDTKLQEIRITSHKPKYKNNW